MNNRIVLGGLVAVAAILVLIVGWLAFGRSDHPVDGMSGGNFPADVDSATMSDRGFVTMMIPHHEDAIEMAEVVLDRSERPELRAFARGVIESQSREIETMRAWQSSWEGNSAMGDFDGQGMMGGGMMMDGMSTDDLRRADDVDLAFIDAMIPHHQGAVMMAERVRLRTERPELKQLAEDIIAEQEAEITQLREWRTAWYGG